MRRSAAALLLASSLLVAGCGVLPGSKKEQSITEKDAARAAELAKLEGWSKLFDAPDRTIPIANQFGYHAPEYKATGGTPAFASTGTDAKISNSFAKAPNTTGFAASGASANQLDTLRFSLSITDPEAAGVAKKRFRDILTQFLAQFKLDLGDDVKTFVTQEVPASKNFGGATMTAEKQAIEGAADGSRRLIVTFTRTGASAPANSKTQG